MAGNTNTKYLIPAAIFLTAAAVIVYSKDHGESKMLNKYLLVDEDGRYQNREIKFIAPGFNMLKDLLTSKTERTPEKEIPTLKPDLQTFLSRGAGTLSSIWLGHSSLLINIDGLVLATDPVFERKISPVGPTRFRKEFPLEAADISVLDAVLISHNHYDHLNKSTIRALSDRTGIFIVPSGLGPVLEKWGVDPEKIRELKWWDSLELRPGYFVTAAPAQHFSGRGIRDRNRTLWNGYAVKGPEHSVYYTGDSGYFSGFREIGERLGPFNMTFVECGAYDRNWLGVHMFPEESVQAHLDLRGDIMHPIHWGTFNLALHDWFDPMRRATAEARKKNVSLATPLPGGCTVYGEAFPDHRWWEDLIDSRDSESAVASGPVPLQTTLDL